MPDHHATEHKTDHPERKRYLKKTPLNEALAVFLAEPRFLIAQSGLPLKRRYIALSPSRSLLCSLHRTTTAPLWTALRYERRTPLALGQFSVVTLTLAARQAGARKLNGTPPAFQYVDTGNPLPSWANAVDDDRADV